MIHGLYERSSMQLNKERPWEANLTLKFRHNIIQLFDMHDDLIMDSENTCSKLLFVFQCTES